MKKDIRNEITRIKEADRRDTETDRDIERNRR
jgi:hypothetical protein